ncbi:MAG: ATPase [Bacteroidota bacterium]
MIDSLLLQLKQYKKKYYLNLLTRGLLLSLALLLSAFIAANAAEYFGNLNTVLRGTLFFTFVAFALYLLVFYIGIPLTRLMNLNHPISDDEAAKQIGKYFPNISDKLLNTLQLSRLNAAENSLLAAGIKQRTAELSVIPFVNAVNFGENRKYLPRLFVPLVIMVVLLFFIPQMFTESTARIINYDKVYLPKAPFSFVPGNKALKAYRNEDFEIRVGIEGRAAPDQVYIMLNGRKHKMEKQGEVYAYTLRQVQKSENFNFEAAGFSSEGYTLEVLSRPDLVSFGVSLKFPAYVHKKNEEFRNAGNFTVPAGTVVAWDFSSTATDSLLLRTETDNLTLAAKPESSERFTLSKRFLASTSYQLLLKNKYSANREEIRYSIEVIPDQYPTLSAEQFRDSSLYNYIVLGGSIADDYGLSRLDLHYKISRAQNSGRKSDGGYTIKHIKIAPGQLSQNYLHNWSLDSLHLQPGDVLDYYMIVWDNDGVFGAKSTKSKVFEMRLPSAADIAKDIEAGTEKTAEALQKSTSKAQQLQKDVEKLKERLRGKRKMDFQDRKAIEELLKKQQEVQQEITKMQDQNRQMNEKTNRFDQQSAEMSEKLKDLQKLMDELLDDETKKLYEELQRLLNEKQPDPDRMENTLEKLENRQENLSKELDRSLELFKKLKFENKLEKTIDKLSKLANEQKELADKTAKEKDAKDKNDKAGDKKDDKAGDKKDDKNGDKKDGDKKDDKSGDKKDDKTGKPDSTGQKDNKDQDGQKPDDKSGDNKDQKGDNKDQNGQKPEDKAGEKPEEKLGEKQDELSKEFQEVKKELDELKKMNEEMQEKQDMEDTSPQERGVEKDQQDSKDQMQKKQFSKSAKKQKEAAEKMERMAGKMKEMQEQEGEEEAEENYEDLRNILENLLTLSFSQESLMKDFKSVSQVDPKFIALAQTQLKLKDDAVIIQDSLEALAKRVFQIRSFVTREVGKMNEYMEESIDAIRRRRQDIGAGKQQLAMTSMNNLALLLSDALKQMQEQMQQQQQASGKGSKKKKKPGKPQPGSSMGQLQKELNRKIGELQKSGMGGNSRQMSEELAKMAAQQEMIRKAVKKMDEQSTKEGKQPGGSGKQIQEMMEKTEQDLVNKRITQETMMRQKDILTRLLEAESAQREREMDEKRESKTAKEIPRSTPPSFDLYLKQKEQQVELLKTIPPTLTPFYKQESNRYFQTLNNGSAPAAPANGSPK